MAENLDLIAKLEAIADPEERARECLFSVLPPGPRTIALLRSCCDGDGLYQRSVHTVLSATPEQRKIVRAELRSRRRRKEPLPLEYYTLARIFED